MAFALGDMRRRRLPPVTEQTSGLTEEDMRRTRREIALALLELDRELEKLYGIARDHEQRITALE